MDKQAHKMKEREYKRIIAVCLLAVIIFFITALKGGSLFTNDAERDAKSRAEQRTEQGTAGDEFAVVRETESSADPAGETDSQKAANAVLITVDVEGAVAAPGILLLPEGTRVYEAIASAGGLSAEADLRDVNQAELLLDGEKLYIPYKADYAEAGTVSGSAAAGRTKQTTAAAGQSDTAKVNLNTADSAKLQTLKGIGPSMAERILQYRSDNGKFKSVEELKKVKGIGAKTFEKLKAHVTVT